MHYLNFFPALFQLLTLSCYCLLPLFLIPQSAIVLLYLLSFNFLSSRENFSYQNNITWGHWKWTNVAFGREMAEAPLGARTTFNDFPQGQRLLFFYVFLPFPTRMQNIIHGNRLVFAVMFSDIWYEPCILIASNTIETHKSG